MYIGFPSAFSIKRFPNNNLKYIIVLLFICKRLWNGIQGSCILSELAIYVKRQGDFQFQIIIRDKQFLALVSQAYKARD